MTIGGPALTLSNGHKMPLVGLGTWQSTPEDVKHAVITAIDAGYRLIDTASAYHNEGAIGEAIKECIDAGKIKREDLFVTTKVWVTHLREEDVEPSLQQSLKLLQLDYVDLLLAHLPTCFDHEMKEQDRSVTVVDNWRGMEGVYNKGLAKAIGVSNYSSEQIERIMKTASVPVHNCQVELHIYFPQHELHATCKKHNVSLTSFATLGSPGRFDYTLPNGQKPAWAPAAACMEDKVVKKLSEKYGKTTAQVLLRYAVDRQIAIIPKSVTTARILENFDLFDFQLTAEEVEQLNHAEHHQRLFPQDFMIGHPEDAFASER